MKFLDYAMLYMTGFITFVAPVAFLLGVRSTTIYMTPIFALLFRDYLKKYRDFKKAQNITPDNLEG